MGTVARDSWITAQQAAVLVKRDRSVIYRWVRQDRIESRETPDGALIYMRASDVIELAQRMNSRRNNKTRPVAA